MLIRSISHALSKKHDQALFFSTELHLHYKETALSGTVEHDQTEGASDMGMTKFIGHLPVSFNQRIIA